ncbi:MAG: metallophosphoesterase [Planctomycetes bacterium]|nr:metallophosphoesterase [Planctomycetota bacterium]MBI3847634.1 metallophosphoesterase [Planctomycetota bacterium]
MRLFGISDLHLGFRVDKPMSIFGAGWERHHEKIEASWRSQVGFDDLVLVPGDLSWAMREEEARPDLDWLGALPGQKVIVKGNHDYWWPKSRAKLAKLLPPGVHPIKRNAVRVHDVLCIGARGCDFVPLHGRTAEQVTFEIARETSDLEASIVDGQRLRAGAARVVALFHYPPFELGKNSSAFTDAIAAAGATLCVYGHLHESPEWKATFQGEAGGVRYRLLSCDALDFRVVPLD